MSIFKKLLGELKNNGKLLVGYVLEQAVTDYPGIVSAVKEAIAEPSQANLINLAVQSVLVLGASHRAIKIVTSVFKK